MRTVLSPLIFIGLLIFCFIPGCTMASSKTTFFKHRKFSCAPFGFPAPPTGVAEGEPPPELAGTWKLSGWYKAGEVQDFPFEDVITFGAHTMAGNDTCNLIGSDYVFVSPHGQFCGSAMTAVGCPEIVTTVTQTDEHGNQTRISDTIPTIPSRYDGSYPELFDSIGFEVRESELWFYLSKNGEEALIFQQSDD